MGQNEESEDLSEFQALTSAILAEIDEAFEGVSRDGGMSWSMSIVADNYGSEEESMAARLLDRDRDWHEVANDPNWTPGRGIGGFAFLDPIGYRYYLPAAMTVAVVRGDDEWLSYSLTLSYEPRTIDYRLSKWSLLDHRQRLCVRHFIEHMVRIYVEGARGNWDLIDAEQWQQALDRYWASVPDEDPNPPRASKAKSTRRRKRPSSDRF